MEASKGLTAASSIAPTALTLSTTSPTRENNTEEPKEDASLNVSSIRHTSPALELQVLERFIWNVGTLELGSW